MTNSMSTPIFDLVVSLLRDAHCEDSPLCATEDLYNEGWLLRIALGLESKGVHCLPFQLTDDSRWLSEPLLYSPFQARCQGDELAERHTHADAVIGHIELYEKTKRGLKLQEDANQFIVVESKLNSPLQAGVKNSPEYDQAARNVACMAESLKRANRSASTVESLGFFVISPEAKLEGHKQLLDRDSIKQKIDQRINEYPDEDRDLLVQWKLEWLDPLTERMEPKCDTWEEVIRRAKQSSPEYGDAFEQFYDVCVKLAGQLPSRTPLEEGQRPKVNSVYSVDDERVVITGAGKDNCRVVPLEFDGPYFPRSKFITTGAFDEPEVETIDVSQCRPQRNATYLWSPPKGADHCPKGETNQPLSPCEVFVTGQGKGLTSRVKISGDQSKDNGFLVFTHHMRTT